jgi:hypothetical protein
VLARRVRGTPAGFGEGKWFASSAVFRVGQAPDASRVGVSSRPLPPPCGSWRGQVMGYCVLTNFFSHASGRALVVGSGVANPAVEAGLKGLRDERKEVRQMASAFLANVTLALEVS